MNFYKHHLGDYAEATAHLTFVEDAAYFRLIRKYYASERPLPADVGTVQRLVGARTREEKKAVSRVLEEFFFLEADGWHNKRCDAEIARARHQMEINRRIANERWKSNKNNELGEQPEAVDEEKTGTNRTRFVHEPSTNRSTNRTRTEVRTVYEQSTNRQPSHKPLSNIHNPLSNKKNLDTGDLNTDTSSLPEDGSESDDSSDSAPALSAQARVVFAHWQKVMNKTRARLDDRRRRCILWALRNYGLDNCLQAIDGCAASAWHQGVNDRGVAYNDLTLIFRNAEKTEHFLEIAQQNPIRTSASAPDPTSAPKPDGMAVPVSAPVSAVEVSRSAASRMADSTLLTQAGRQSALAAQAWLARKQEQMRQQSLRQPSGGGSGGEPETSTDISAKADMERPQTDPMEVSEPPVSAPSSPVAAPWDDFPVSKTTPR